MQKNTTDTLVNKVRFTSTLTPELLEKLRELSANTRIPQSVLIEEAISDLLKKHEKK